MDFLRWAASAEEVFSVSWFSLFFFLLYVRLAVAVKFKRCFEEKLKFFETLKNQIEIQCQTELIKTNDNRVYKQQAVLIEKEHTTV